MKWVIIFLTAITLLPSLLGGGKAEGMVRYTHSRPYSWYYPYNYNYYYPQLKVYGSCQLTYIDGVFVYVCQ